jgi:hypothetical protein
MKIVYRQTRKTDDGVLYLLFSIIDHRLIHWRRPLTMMVNGSV